jgi:GH35 family endo-1,4-beta-xylanase
VALTDAERDAAAADLAVLKEQIKHLKEEIAHERELREQATEMANIALARQAIEYERRLEDLNGAHAQRLADRSELVQKSVYELTQRDLGVYQREMAEWKLQVTAENTLLAERLRAEQAASAERLRKDAADMAAEFARSQRMTQLLGVLLAALTFFLAHFTR